MSSVFICTLAPTPRGSTANPMTEGPGEPTRLQGNCPRHLNNSLPGPPNALVHLTAGQVQGPVRLSVQRSLNQRIAQNKLRRKLCCPCPPLPTLPFLSSWLLIRDCTKFQTKLALGKFLPRGKHFSLNLPLHLIKSSLNPTEEQVNDIFSNKPTRFKHQPH